MPDFERSLEARGVEESQNVGRYLMDEGLLPERALVSPSFRTRETWHASHLSNEQIDLLFLPELYLASTADLLEAIRTHGGDARVLLVVGHNPSVHDLAVDLVEYGDRYAFARMREYFPTAAFAVLDLAEGTWRDLDRRTMRLDRFRVPETDQDPSADL